MEKEQLQATLRQLQDELAQVKGVDAETLERLRTLSDDIERAMNERETASAHEVESSANGLRDLLLKYEAEHPQTAAAIGRVADALAAMGI